MQNFSFVVDEKQNIEPTTIIVTVIIIIIVINIVSASECVGFNVSLDT